MLGKYFARIETVELQSSFRFDDADDVLEWFKKRYETQAKFFSVNEKKIREYFAGRIEEEGQIIITTTSHFQHCSN